MIPLLLLLILIIYYLVSLTGALREANQDLRTQLQKEREEERKKIFKVPEVKQAEPTATTLTNRWRKVLEASSPVTPTQPPDFDTEEYKNQARKGKPCQVRDLSSQLIYFASSFPAFRANLTHHEEGVAQGIRHVG